MYTHSSPASPILSSDAIFTRKRLARAHCTSPGAAPTLPCLALLPSALPQICWNCMQFTLAGCSSGVCVVRCCGWLRRSCHCAGRGWSPCISPLERLQPPPPWCSARTLDTGMLPQLLAFFFVYWQRTALAQGTQSIHLSSQSNTQCTFRLLVSRSHGMCHALPTGNKSYNVSEHLPLGFFFVLWAWRELNDFRSQTRIPTAKEVRQVACTILHTFMLLLARVGSCPRTLLGFFLHSSVRIRRRTLSHRSGACSHASCRAPYDKSSGICRSKRALQVVACGCSGRAYSTAWVKWARFHSHDKSAGPSLRSPCC